MKILNLKNTRNLSRSEMKEIVAGFGEASLTDEGATVLCNNGESVSITSCDDMDKACEGIRGGAKICSGGGN
jgi:hypothetical protein